MRISIVTISFNQKAYLQAAMESVLSQQYPDLDYIVVDPGSTDGSRELIQAYSDRLAHIVFEIDRGPADGLNKGFALATGDVYGFLNSDDLLTPGSLQAVAEHFRTHPECNVVLGNGHIVDGDGRLKRHIKARGFTTRRYLRSGTQWLQQSTFFTSKAFRDAQGFNPEDRACWDYELFATIAKQGARAGYIDKDLSAFRIHAGSITGTGSNFAVYRSEQQRIFQQITGRSRHLGDDLLEIAYRIEGRILRLMDGFNRSSR